MLAVLSIILLASASAQSVDPPVWPAAFNQRFVETYITNNLTYHSYGELWYDAKNNRSRLDRKDGIHDFICGSVLNQSTACTNLIVGGKRYIVFPEKQTGCFCCDSAHGCGILRQDWLSNATYMGKEDLLGESFHKWSKPDGNHLDYYWATVDAARIPRRLNEADMYIADYLMNTFSTAPIADSIFELPSYVKGDCPSTSVCQKFREIVQ